MQRPQPLAREKQGDAVEVEAVGACSGSVRPRRSRGNGRDRPGAYAHLYMGGGGEYMGGLELAPGPTRTAKVGYGSAAYLVTYSPLKWGTAARPAALASHVEIHPMSVMRSGAASTFACR